MSMRKQFVITTEELLKNDDKLIVLLGDIGVFGFNKSFINYPDRIYNIGILEQSTIGIAAGLAMSGFIPVVHTIAPFIVERGLEQLKLDFGYQQLGGNFISVGSSYDYAALGCTHHCPADIGTLLNIPEMEIIIPGTSEEFDKLFKQAYKDNHPTYYRLTERENNSSQKVRFGQAEIIKKGELATVIAIGPTLKAVLEACENKNVTILYYTTISPFDVKTLQENCQTGKILLCEPYYSGQLAYKITKSLYPKPVIIDYIGVKHEFLRNYGQAEEHDEFIGLTKKNIEEKIIKLIKL